MTSLQPGDCVMLRVVRRPSGGVRFRVFGWCPAVFDHATEDHTFFRLPSGRMWVVDNTYGPWAADGELPDLVAKK